MATVNDYIVQEGAVSDILHFDPDEAQELKTVNFNIDVNRGTYSLETLITHYIDGLFKAFEYIQQDWAEATNMAIGYNDAGAQVVLPDPPVSTDLFDEAPGDSEYTGEEMQIATKGGDLNFRASAGTSGDIIGSLKNGESVEVISVDAATGWAKVRVNGQEGYVSSKYLEAKADATPTEPADAASSAATSSSPDAGASASVAASDTDGTGAAPDASASLAKDSDAGVPANDTSGADAAVTQEMQVKTKGGNLNFRASAGTSGEIKGSLKNGSDVEVISVDEKTGWAKVRVDGQEGYVSSKYLEAKADSTPAASSVTPAATSAASSAATSSSPDAGASASSTEMYVHTQGGNLNVRSGAGTNNEIIGKLPKDSSVEAVGTSDDGGWTKVKVSGSDGQGEQYGFVKSDYLTSENPVSTLDTPKTYNVTTNGGHLNIRSGASTSSAISGQFDNGAEISVVGVTKDGNWAQIKNSDGTIGWVSSKWITPKE